MIYGNKKLKISVVSGKGGVGKSMLTSALSMLFSKKEKIVALDCDADTPNLAIWLNEVEKWDKKIPVFVSKKPEFDFKKCKGCGLCEKNCRFLAIKMIKGKPHLNPFLCEGCGACEIICPQGAIKLRLFQTGQIKIKKTKYGFPLVSGQLFPGETGSGKIVDEIKKEGEKFNYKIMLIDSAPGTGCPVISSLRDTNFAILITEPTISGFSDLKKILKLIYHFNIPWGLVINKWDINPKLTEKMERWAQDKFLGKISYDKKIFQAINYLKPILETKLKAKMEIESIYQKLNKFFLW